MDPMETQILLVEAVVIMVVVAVMLRVALLRVAGNQLAVGAVRVSCQQELLTAVCIAVMRNLRVALLQQSLFQHRPYQVLRLQVMRNKEMAMQE